MQYSITATASVTETLPNNTHLEVNIHGYDANTKVFKHELRLDSKNIHRVLDEMLQNFSATVSYSIIKTSLPPSDFEIFSHQFERILQALHEACEYSIEMLDDALIELDIKPFELLPEFQGLVVPYTVEVDKQADHSAMLSLAIQNLAETQLSMLCNSQVSHQLNHSVIDLLPAQPIATKIPSARKL